ncbi:MAG: AraC family transcriptional regulator [Cyanobacteria bacterium J06639_14]
MKTLTEHLFSASVRPHQMPLRQIPQWGHWLETPDLKVILVPGGQLEIDLVAPVNMVSTRFVPGRGLAAFNSDTWRPYRSQPGGFDVIPKAANYRSRETAGQFLVCLYESSIMHQIAAEYTADRELKLLPGQIQQSPKGQRLAQAMYAFFNNSPVSEALYLESLATLIMGHVIAHHSNLSGCLKKVPDLLTPYTLKIAIAYIQDHLDRSLSLLEIAQAVGLSAYYFAHAFKATTGIPPHQYVRQCRLRKAQQLLQHSHQSIAEIAYATGFGSQSHMTTVFRKTLQTTPAAYRKQVVL